MMGMIVGAEELFLDKMGMAVGMVVGMTHLGHGGGYDLDVPGDVKFERLELLDDLTVLVVYLAVTFLSVMEQR